MSIFDPRPSGTPFEYPHLYQLIDAISASYWTHHEYNYDPDEHDLRFTMSHVDHTVCTRSLLGIVQVEDKVKTFWPSIHRFFPKEEISDVGFCFADSEVRHKRAYKEPLVRIGVRDYADEEVNAPALHARTQYLQEISELARSDDREEFLLAVILFTMLVEYNSLFTQFLIVMSFNRKNGLMKGISNAVEATTKEEVIHSAFGFELVDIIKNEHPEMWTEELQQRIIDMCQRAFEADCDMLDWFFEEGDASCITKHECREYQKFQMNEGLDQLGLPPLFTDIDQAALDSTYWFVEELNLTSNKDFFNKRNTNYSARSQSFGVDDI